MLGGSGKNIGSAIKDMVGQQSVLGELSTNSSFDWQNLSTLLKEAGAGIKQAIEAIVKRSSKLEQYLKTSEFNATNIANILNGSGKNIGRSIDIRKRQITCILQ